MSRRSCRSRLWSIVKMSSPLNSACPEVGYSSRISSLTRSRTWSSGSAIQHLLVVVTRAPPAATHVVQGRDVVRAPLPGPRATRVEAAAAGDLLEVGRGSADRLERLALLVEPRDRGD